MKKFVYNEVACFQASIPILLKVIFSYCILSTLQVHLFLGTHFYDCFHHLLLQSILLSCKSTSKTVGLLRKFPNVLLKTSKLFVRPHLHHCDIVHDQANNLAFHQKVQAFQFNASLAVTGTIRETSRKNLHQDLGLESLQLRRWYRELCCFVKIYKLRLFLNSDT